MKKDARKFVYMDNKRIGQYINKLHIGFILVLHMNVTHSVCFIQFSCYTTKLETENNTCLN